MKHTVTMNWIDFDVFIHSELYQAFLDRRILRFRLTKNGRDFTFISGVITTFVHNTGDDYFVVQEVPSLLRAVA